MPGKRPSLLSALSILIIVGGLLFWWVNALTNEDPLWFVPAFNAPADWITVYWDGQTVMLFPGDPGYDAIMASFSDGVAHWSGYEGGVGLSDESLALYRDTERLLELHYNEPVHVHTRQSFAQARVFFVPLSGTHAIWRRVFAGLNDTPRIGVLNMSEERFAALQEAVNSALAMRS